MARGKKRSNKPRNEGSTASESSGVTVEQIASMPAEQHGDRAERVRAQQQIQAGEQAAAPAPGGPAPGPAPPGGQQGDPAGELARLAQAIFADTQRPDEPLTAGAPSFGPPTPTAGPDPELEPLRPSLHLLELLTGAPNASSDTRQLVRRVRASMPVPPPPLPPPET